MTLESHKIYVIIGSCGEFSDHREWPVTWRPTLKEAEAVVEILKAQAFEYHTLHERNMYRHDFYEDYDLRPTMLDPLFSHDYSGTEYCIWTIADDFVGDRPKPSYEISTIEYLRDKICLTDGCTEMGLRLWSGGPCIYLCAKHYDDKSKLWFEQNHKHPSYEIDTLEYLTNIIDYLDE
jgi:hypothetical protein